jgi:hypothetical protein
MNEHDLVVLRRDLPEHGLEIGDVGVVVALHGSEAIEAEFVNAAGETLAVVTLETSAVRPMEGSEILHVRAVSVA